MRHQALLFQLLKRFADRNATDRHLFRNDAFLQVLTGLELTAYDSIAKHVNYLRSQRSRLYPVEQLGFHRSNPMSCAWGKEELMLAYSIMYAGILYTIYYKMAALSIPNSLVITHITPSPEKV
jgi:hypothetical protein